MAHHLRPNLSMTSAASSRPGSSAVDATKMSRKSADARTRRPLASHPLSPVFVCSCADQMQTHLSARGSFQLWVWMEMWLTLLELISYWPPQRATFILRYRVLEPAECTPAAEFYNILELVSHSSHSCDWPHSNPGRHAKHKTGLSSPMLSNLERPLQGGVFNNSHTKFSPNHTEDHYKDFRREVRTDVVNSTKP